MNNFEYYGPTRIVFGEGSIRRLSDLVPADTPILLLYGGGSIKRNGVYDQVMSVLEGRDLVEFGGIEVNPDYETCMKAVAVARERDVGFLLAVGGGSVLDAAKFIAAAVYWQDGEPWDLFRDRGARIFRALPLGSVMTLPATGSEMNKNAVISRRATKEKLAFVSPHVFPQFSILDPATTFSLPPRQIGNGVVDAFVHVTEQYVVARDTAAPLQDRQAEAVLLTLIKEGPVTLAEPTRYDSRANLVWAATCALNGTLSCGVPGDWATHMIGHELTALYGLDHAQSLAVVLPGLWRHQRDVKRERLLHYAARIWGLTEGPEEARIDQAIDKTESFFQSMGVPTRLADYGLPADAPRETARNQARRGVALGERQTIRAAEIEAILQMQQNGRD